MSRLKKQVKASVTVFLVTHKAVDVSQSHVGHVVGGIIFWRVCMKFFYRFLGIRQSIVIPSDSNIQVTQVRIAQMLVWRHRFGIIMFSNALSAQEPLFRDAVLSQASRLAAFLVIIAKPCLQVGRCIHQRVHACCMSLCLPYIANSSADVTQFS